MSSESELWTPGLSEHFDYISVSYHSLSKISVACVPLCLFLGLKCSLKAESEPHSIFFFFQSQHKIAGLGPLGDKGFKELPLNSLGDILPCMTWWPSSGLYPTTLI